MRGPWNITVAAVRRWLAITRRPEKHFDDAAAELGHLARDTMKRYEVAGRAPRTTRTGAYVYRSAYTYIGRSRTQVDLIVVPDRHEPQDQLVDIHWGGERR